MRGRVELAASANFLYLVAQGRDEFHKRLDLIIFLHGQHVFQISRGRAILLVYGRQIFIC
jgi:hypothetical protein